MNILKNTIKSFSIKIYKINDKLNLYKEHFPNLEEERYMFMAMLDLSVQLIRSEKRNDTEPYEAVLQNITAEIESTLASE